MLTIKTYQDLLALEGDEAARMDFIRAAINEHKSNSVYQTAILAEKYYDGENPTINQYEKILYDIQGRACRDMWTANHKIASHFFGMVIDQENSYLLGNGVTFGDAKTKDRLGSDFDQRIMDAGEFALIAGQSFGFWNLDHLEVFRFTEFVPLYDEEDGAIKAGIRFWQIADNKPLRVSLFELDGYTDYIQGKENALEILNPKRSYKQIVRISTADGTEIFDGENYPGFPIIPLKNNGNGKSELTGRQNTIDALDLISSGMVNTTDEGNLIYWILKGAGGMDDIDDVKFRDRVKALKVVHTDDGVEAQMHTAAPQVEGISNTIDMLKRKLYEDFQAFDSAAVSAGNQTATAIHASYVPLDMKVDKFERQVTQFISGILKIAGIDDRPSYTRNKIINTSEEIQAVILCAPYFDDEYISKKLLTILGDIDQYEEMMRRKAADDLERVSAELEGNDEDGEMDFDK